MQTRLLAIDRDKPVNVGGLQDYRVIPRPIGTNWVFEKKLQNIFIFLKLYFYDHKRKFLTNYHFMWRSSRAESRNGSMPRDKRIINLIAIDDPASCAKRLC